MLIDAFTLLCYILLYLFITRDAIHTLLFLLFEWRNSRQRESSRCIFVLGSFFLSIIVMSRFLEDDLFRENKLKRRRENGCGKYRLLRNYWKFTLTREFIFNSSTKLAETFFFFFFFNILAAKVSWTKNDRCSPLRASRGCHKLLSL